MSKILEKRFWLLWLILGSAFAGLAQPTITFSPSNGATNVLESTTITLSSNQSLRRDSDNTDLDNTNVSSVLVLKETNAGGADIPFTATINAGDDVITISPGPNLPSNTLIYVALTNVESVGVGGGSLTPDPTTLTFTVRDYAPPTAAFSPADGATNIATTTPITITFNKAVQNIDNSAITNANLSALLTFKTTDASGTDVPYTATINAGKTAITITPAAALTNNQVYYLDIDPVESTIGVASVMTTATFTTTNDTQAPAPTFNPLNGTIDVVNANSITITFDEAIRDITDAAFTNATIDSKITLKLTDATGADIAFNATIGGGSTIVTVNPSVALPNFAVIYVAVNNVEDQFDNAITTAASVTFTTGDGTAPVITFNPTNGSSGLAVASNLTISFDEAIRNTDNSTITNSNVGSLITLKTTNSSGTDVLFAATINGAKTQITINPNSNLSANQVYYLAIGQVENSYSLATTPTSITFATVDTQPPVPSFSPANAAVNVSNTGNITITFNEPIRNTDNSALTDLSIDGKVTLKITDAAGANIAFDATIDLAKTTIIIDPTAALPDLTVIYVAINNVEDNSDNQIVTPQSVTFTTSDITAPAITFNPPDGSTSFSITQNITITFNEPIRNINGTDITDLNADNLIALKLTNALGAAIGFTATINAGKTVITIDPTSNLVANQAYYLTLDPIEDTSNNATVSTNITFQTQQLAASAGTNANACSGQPITLNGSALGGNGFYQFAWTGPNGFTSSSPTPTVTPTTLGANLYTLTVTDSDNNTDDATVTITLNATPTSVTFAPSGADAAFRTNFIVTEPPYELNAEGLPVSGTVTFSGFGVSLDPNGKYYFSPGVAGTNNNPITITAKYTINGCSVSATKEVAVTLNNTIVNNLEDDYCTAEQLQSPILSHNQVAFYWPSDDYVRMRIKVLEQKVFSFATFQYEPYYFNSGYGEYIDVLAGQAVADQILQEVPGSNPKTYRINPSAIPNLTGAVFGSVAGRYSVAVIGVIPGDTYEWFEGESVFTLKLTPGAPFINPLPNYCVNDDVSDNLVQLSAGGDLVTWYANSGPSNPLNPAGITDTRQPKFSELGVTESFSGTFTRYVTQSLNGCESPSSTLNIIVYTNPAAPTVSNPTPICSGGVLPTIVANGSATASQYSWYGANGNNPDFNTIYSPTINTVNAKELLVPDVVGSTTTFKRFVTQWENGCQSDEEDIDIVVKETPIAPLASSVEYCLNETIANITVTPSGGAAVHWYTDPALISEILPISSPTNATATELGLSSAAPNFYMRYITQVLAGCESLSKDISITVNGLPGVSIRSSEADLTKLCKSGFNVDLVGVPGDGSWSGTAAPALSNIDQLNGTASLSPASALFQPGQSYTLIYTYVDNATSCENDITETLTFFPSITPSLNVGDACDQQFVSIENTSAIVPNGAASTIDGYEWNFGDGDVLLEGAGTTSVDGANAGNTNGTYVHPFHKFSGAIGTKTIKYRMRTSDNCTVESQLSVEVNPLPVANFTWAGVCEGKPTVFNASTSNVPSIPNSEMTYTWNFTKNGMLTTGVATLSANGNNASVPYTAIGKDIVSMTATTDDNCYAIVEKPVYIVPEYPAIEETNAYDQDFEADGADGWIDGGNNSSWAFGTPDAASLFSGNGQVWATVKNGAIYNPNEESWILSRCYDFSIASRPVLSLDLRADTPGGIDGAVLQYNITGNIENDADWIVVGTVGTGINWYEQLGIASQPGNQASSDYGWSGNIEDGRYPEWKRATYKLDELVGQSDVVFRIAFASTNKVTRQGFGFDNVFIGERSRLVLVENFTNSSASAKVHNDLYNSLGAPGEVVKLEYHTSFPGSDPLYLQNTALNDARSAFYGLNSSYSVRIDGQYQDGLVNSWAGNLLDNKVLTPAPVKITFDQIAGGGAEPVTMRVNILNTSGAPLDLTNAHVFTAIVEKQITDGDYMGSSQSTELNFVARQFLPSPSGVRINRILADDETFSQDVIWDKTILLDNSEAQIAAFVQEIGGTREVYQSAIYDNTPPAPPSPTGVEYNNFSKKIQLFPNPSDKEVHVLLPEASKTPTPIRLTDSFGRDITSTEFNAGELRKSLDTKELSAGVYFIQLQTPNGLVVKKLVVAH
jgi:hypothetical protein